MALAVDGLSMAYGGVVALDRATLDVPAGPPTVLLGPSGSGKTTLLRCVAGLCRPRAGSIRLDGVELTRLAPHRRRLGVVLQAGRGLLPDRSVAANLEFPLDAPRAERRRRVAEVLDRLQLTELASRRPAEVSQGQRQRVALGRALVADPGALLLDEPFGALDPALRGDLRRLLAGVCAERSLPTLLVSHDPADAESLAGPVALLLAGRVAERGSLAELRARTLSPEGAGLLGAGRDRPAP